MKKLIRFIKYHNAFAIGFGVIVFSVGSAFAMSPDLQENLKDALVSSEEVVRSIDNSHILSVDLDNFDFALQIEEVAEDEKNYYVSYRFKTVGVQDYIWMEVWREKVLTVSKRALGDKDLGLYIIEELGEVVDFELAYLKEVQQLEGDKGLARKIATIEYTGLIGRF